MWLNPLRQNNRGLFKYNLTSADRDHYQLPDAPVLDLHEDLLRLEVSFTIRQQLGQIEERDALCEQLRYHAA